MIDIAERIVSDSIGLRSDVQVIGWIGLEVHPAEDGVRLLITLRGMQGTLPLTRAQARHLARLLTGTAEIVMAPGREVVPVRMEVPA